MSSLGMKVMAYDPFIDPNLAAEMDLELVSLKIYDNQIISMHAPLTRRHTI